ncbi:MAG: hypothetical protein P8Z35_21670, partial [Ignavibacteriaceae bacterium]
FNAHSTIVSKILLEMEHGSIRNIDNIVICGEDDSDELKYTVNEAYPSTKVIFQNIVDVEIEDVDSFSSEASFIVPVAVAEEYFAELSKEFTGINLLPSYIKEEQKLINLGWKGYAMVLLIILSAGFFLMKVKANIDELNTKNEEIKKIQLIQAQNRETVAKIQSFENKIKNFDRTKNILDQLSSGTGILSTQMKKLSDYTNKKRNLWISQINLNMNKNLKINGYTMSRPVVKELSDTYNGSILQNILYDPLRDFRTFKFSIDAGNLLGVVKNEAKK